MRLVGLDLGSKTCGVSISDALGLIASPLTTIRFNDEDYFECFLQVKKICLENNVETVVLGYPKHMNNDLSQRAQITLDFKTIIEENSNLKVILLDERLTTRQVNSIMIASSVRRDKRKEKKDELAALIILQNYLDYRGRD